MSVRKRRPGAGMLAGFLALGFVLWMLEQQLTESGLINRTPLVITASAQQAMLAEWEVGSGVTASPRERARLLALAIDDEIFYREALKRELDVGNPAVEQRLALLMSVISGEAGSQPEPATVKRLAAEARALGLAHGDLAIRRHLILQMKLLASAGADAIPADAVLHDFMAAHPAEFRGGRQWDFRQHYFSFRHYGNQAQALALRARAQLNAGNDAVVGDPWPTGNVHHGLDSQDVAHAFGEAVTDHLVTMPTAVWSAPVASPFGWHVLFVDRIEPERVLPLAEVRDQVIARWRLEQSRKRLAIALPIFKRRYSVIVEPLLAGISPHAIRPEVPDVPD